MMIESEMKENSDDLRDFLGLTSNVSSFGYKYVVVTAYWISKKKIGELHLEYLKMLNQVQKQITLFFLKHPHRFYQGILIRNHATRRHTSSLRHLL